jgi:hypothetical protein
MFWQMGDVRAPESAALPTRPLHAVSLAAANPAIGVCVRRQPMSPDSLELSAFTQQGRGKMLAEDGY